MVASEERARQIAEARIERAARVLQQAAGGGGLAAATEAKAAPGGGPKDAARGAARAKNSKLGKEAAVAAVAAAAEAAAAAAEAAAQKRELVLLLKADVQGTAEALRAAVESLASAMVGVRVVQCAVGPVSDSDCDLAAATGAPAGFG